MPKIKIEGLSAETVKFFRRAAKGNGITEAEAMRRTLSWAANMGRNYTPIVKERI